MNRGRAAWILCAVDLTVLVLVFVIRGDTQPLFAALYVVGVGSYTAIGALLTTRVPTNPIGALLSLVGSLVVVIVTLNAYALLGLRATPTWPLASLSGVIGDALFVVPIVVAVVAVPLIFPDGHLPSRRFRVVVICMVIGLASWMLGAVNVRSDMVVLFTFPIAFGGGVAATVVRFRRGNAVLRAQVKWLAAVVGIAAVAVMSGLFLFEANVDLATGLVIVGALALATMPLAIANAILRYRLYEIDRIISRTIAYAVITAILAIVFASVILAVGAVLTGLAEGLTPSGQGRTIAVAISTLVVFALFQPVRRRVQRSVDRRFDRAKFDADATIRGFSSRLRADVDLGVVRGEVVRTAGAAVRPTAAALWLRGDPS